MYAAINKHAYLYIYIYIYIYTYIYIYMYNIVDGYIIVTNIP